MIEKFECVKGLVKDIENESARIDSTAGEKIRSICSNLLETL